ncbi:MAG: LysR substrate-binding domain-containing protein, partial [Marinobacter sp.]|uniref:LysR substrate-binding domain-containing protein n=1 Tax=Marinobacter sp. TaxID=50741 RepID=UPI00299F1D1B
DQTAHELLRKDRLVVIARNGNPLIRGGLTMADYLAARHVLVSSRSEGPGIEDFELSRLGVQRNIRLRCQHYYAACRVVENTDLLLTMPETYARLIAERAGITLLSPPAELPGIDVHLYWHKPYEKEPALIWFRRQLQAVAGSADSS